MCFVAQLISPSTSLPAYRAELICSYKLTRIRCMIYLSNVWEAKAMRSTLITLFSHCIWYKLPHHARVAQAQWLTDWNLMQVRRFKEEKLFCMAVLSRNWRVILQQWWWPRKRNVIDLIIYFLYTFIRLCFSPFKKNHTQNGLPLFSMHNHSILINNWGSIEVTLYFSYFSVDLLSKSVCELIIAQFRPEFINNGQGAVILVSDGKGSGHLFQNSSSWAPMSYRLKLH